MEELAAAAGVRVDTLRFYQARGLLAPPRRRGRLAIYGEDHLERLRRIRALKQEGFSLAQIRRVVAEPGVAAPEAEAEAPLLAALVRESVGNRTLSRAELAREAGIPEALIRAGESAGLLAPLRVDGEERFTEADLEMARAGLAMLEAGLPLQALLEPAAQHVRNIEQVCDAGIEIFDRHVRKSGPAAEDADAIAAVFRKLLPEVTRIVALHFQRTLVNRALARLEGREEREALAAAIQAADSARLEVGWR